MEDKATERGNMGGKVMLKDVARVIRAALKGSKSCTERCSNFIKLVLTDLARLLLVSKRLARASTEGCRRQLGGRSACPQGH